MQPAGGAGGLVAVGLGVAVFVGAVVGLGVAVLVGVDGAGLVDVAVHISVTVAVDDAVGVLVLAAIVVVVDGVGEGGSAASPTMKGRKVSGSAVGPANSIAAKEARRIRDKSRAV